MRRKRLWIALLLLGALVLSLPLLVNLEVFRTPVHRALERQVGRRVEFSALTARLLPRPGIVARGVLVHEEEGFGHEPFLYAEEVHCNLSGGLLWRGEVDCAEFYFLRPSINLVRRADGQWNVAQFLMAGKAAGAGSKPAVSVSEGRINFKLGPDKQVVALVDARARLEAQPDGRWQVAFTARPVRVDRRLNETGELALSGEVSPGAAGSAPSFRFDAGLENGSLAQWWVLFAGTELPVRAQASLRAHFEGTLAEWGARGTLALEGLRRWDLVAPSRSPRWQIAFRVRRLAGDDLLVVEEATVRAQQSVLGLSGQVENLRAQPRWSFEANSDRLALDELGAQFSSLKANVDSGLRWEGEAQLALVAKGPLTDWRGTLAVPAGASLHVPGISEPVQLAELRLHCERGRLTLDPLAVRFSAQRTLTLSGEVRLDAPGLPYRLRWQSAQIELEPLWQTAEALGWDVFESARWNGRARVDLEWRGEALGDEAPRWQGAVQLAEAGYHPPELNAGLGIPSAQLVWSGTALQIQPLELRLGENSLTGSMVRPRDDAPWEVNLSGARLRLADLNALVNPAQRGLFERLVRAETRTAANWSRGAAVGKLRVQEVAAGPFRLGAFEADGDWRAGALSFQRLRFRAYAGRFDGRFQADFRDSPPRYRLAGNIRQMAVAGLLADATSLANLYTGLASAEVALESAGTRPRELVRNLQGRVIGGINHGAIMQVDLLAAMAAATGAEGAPGSDGTTAMESLVGEFRVAEEQVELDAVQLIVAGAALELSGRVGFDKRLDLQVRGQPLRVAGRELAPVAVRTLGGVYRLAGTLARPEVEVVEPPASPGAP
ncbi:MAG: AsmA family protein [Candidatus Acidiferrales bacterium]